MELPAAEEAARRTRAALAYADIDIKQAQERVGISTATMARIVSMTKPRGFSTEAEMRKISNACEVPIAFLEHGFALEEPELAERVEALEHRLEALGDLSDLVDATRRTTAAAAAAADADRADEAESETRGTADASRGSSRARDEEKRRSADGVDGLCRAPAG